jgi:hypothetical protein
MRSNRLFIVLGLFILVPFTAQAQSSADISISTTVLESLDITPINDLVFGSIIAGSTESVEPDMADAGSFQIAGEANAEVDLSLTLPSTLVNTLDGSLSLDIQFRSDDGIVNTDNDPYGGNTFVPSSGTITNLSALSGELFLFIGGELQPSQSQEPGEYEGTITLTVDYTGN